LKKHLLTKKLFEKVKRQEAKKPSATVTAFVIELVIRHEETQFFAFHILTVRILASVSLFVHRLLGSRTFRYRHSFGFGIEKNIIIIEIEVGPEMAFSESNMLLYNKTPRHKNK
jgi:hypothetical protein